MSQFTVFYVCSCRKLITRYRRKVHVTPHHACFFFFDHLIRTANGGIAQKIGFHIHSLVFMFFCGKKKHIPVEGSIVTWQYCCKPNTVVGALQSTQGHSKTSLYGSNWLNTVGRQIGNNYYYTRFNVYDFFPESDLA